MRRQLVIIALAFATMYCAVASAASYDVNLNFAALDQSQWAPGPALDESAEYRFPDPYFSTSVPLGNMTLDPVGALLGFIGNFLGIPLATGVSIAPTATLSTGFEANYHVNSGSIDLAYPTQVVLSLPDQVNYGEAFMVGAQRYSGAGSASSYRSAAVAALLGSPAADRLDRFATAGAEAGLVTPQAGFATQFPYAEARLDFHLDASAQLNAQVCAAFLGCGQTDPLSLQGFDKTVQVVELNSLSGLRVLDRDVIAFDQPFELPGGIGTLAFHSPSSLGVAGSRQGGDALAGHDAQDVLSLGFDVDQLLPLIGPLLHNSLGPFAYDLASVEPTLSLGISQTMTFDPSVMVDLHFGDPVIDTRTNSVTRDVRFALGDSVALMPASIGSGNLLGALQVTPTFTLANATTNDTQLTLAASIDVDTLALTTPVHAGPVCCDPIELARYDLGSIGPSDPFQIEVPAITAGTRSVARGVSAGAGGVGALEAWYEAAAAGLTALATSAPDANGLAPYQLWAGDMLVATAYGQLLETPVAPGSGALPCHLLDSCPPDPCLNGQQVCDIQLLTDQDIWFLDPAHPNDPLDLGRLLCLACIDPHAPPATSLSLTDDEGNPLFFSDVRDFPAIPAVEEILDPSSAYYDAQLATSQYFDHQVVTPAESPHSVPEPATLALFGCGFTAVAAARRRCRPPQRR